MADIEGFTDFQNAALQGVVVGDLLLVQRLAAPAAAYDSEDGNDDTEGSDEEGDHDEGNDYGGDGDASPESHTNEAMEEMNGNGGGSDASSQEHSWGLTEETDSSATSASTLNADDATSTDEMGGYDEPTETDFLPPTMYMIVSVIKDHTNSNVTDLGVIPLQFNDKVGTTHGDHSYHIFGNRCEAYHGCEGACKDVISVTTVAAEGQFSFMVNPGGDYVRYIADGSRRCIGTCNDGFLDDTSCLSDMVKDYEPEMLLWEQNGGIIPDNVQKPLCPVCIGADLLKEQQALQHDLLITSVIDFTELLEYYGRLATRRNELQDAVGGYHFVQFDERLWNMAFDDMLSNEDEDRDGDEDGERFEPWEEAQDPNSNVQLRPASEDTIAALPRKHRSAVSFDGDDDICCIDQEVFVDDSVLVQLPCGHAKFHEECIVTWLQQFNNCPICRETVPDVNGENEGEQATQSADVLRMSLTEALMSLSLEQTTNLHEIDPVMLEMVFSSAREDRSGWRTETAIACLQAEIAKQRAVTEIEDEIAGEALDAEGDAIMSDAVADLL